MPFRGDRQSALASMEAAQPLRECAKRLFLTGAKTGIAVSARVTIGRLILPRQRVSAGRGIDTVRRRRGIRVTESTISGDNILLENTRAGVNCKDSRRPWQDCEQQRKLGTICRFLDD
jgi:hypothetical protein